MTQITPHLLWIGHAGSGCAFRALYEAGIAAVVQVAMEEPAHMIPRDFIYCRIPLIDGPSNDDRNLLLALRNAAWLLQEKIPALICCGAGMSRSPAVAAGGLAISEKIPLEVALAQIATQHGIEVTPGLCHDIVRVVQQLRDSNAV